MRRWWQPLLSIGGSLATASISALLRRALEMPEASATSGVRDRRGARRTAHHAPRLRGGGLRAHVVDFLSDVLAETYRKVRTTGEHERKRL